MVDVLPGQLGDVNQAVDTTEIDECAELCDARYLALKNCSDLKLCFLHTL